jgi:hypothetical protein
VAVLGEGGEEDEKDEKDGEEDRQANGGEMEWGEGRGRGERGGVRGCGYGRGSGELNHEGLTEHDQLS